MFKDKKIFKKNNTKSPLKDRPLRIPGQSLNEEIQNILDDELTTISLLPLFLIVLTTYDWLLWYQVIKLPNPIQFTVVTIVILFYSIYRFIKLRKRLRSLSPYLTPQNK